MPIYKGQTKVVKLYKGTTQIIKRYKGTNLIFSALPSAFQQVEFLQSTGAQYIETNWQPTNNCKVTLSFVPTNTNAQVIMGGGIDNVSCSFVGHAANLQFFLQSGIYYITNSVLFTANTRYNTISIINGSKLSLNVNGTTVNGSGNVSLSTRNQLLFMSTRADGTVANYAYAKLYSCKIYDNNVLVRNFVPCYRKADNVAGLYDLVNDVFYTNAGTGTFIIGGNV